MAKERKTKGRADETDAFVGQRLRELRTAAGLNQSELADKAGTCFQQIQKYENGTNRVAAGKLFLIAGALGVPIASFFPGAEGENAVVERLTRENAALREVISWTSQNLKDSLKKGALEK